MTKRLLAAIAVLALATMPGQIAFSHTDDTSDPTTKRCDAWKRNTGTSHDNTHPNDENIDQTTADTPEDLYVMDGGDGQGYEPRYGIRGRDFYIVAIGGGGYGAGGSVDPEGRSGEGGVVAGEVDVDNGVAPGADKVPDVDFSVGSFSLDDPLQPRQWVDTAASACVSVGNNKVDPACLADEKGVEAPPNVEASGEGNCMFYADTSSLPHP